MKNSMRNSHFCAAVSLLCALAVCLGSISAYAETCNEVRSEVLRLHVIANSDTQTDQNIKLLVRDRLLTVGSEYFLTAVSVSQAADAVRSAIEELTAQANQVLAENGVDYTAEIAVKREYFDTRTYNGVTLPAGVYLAVCAVLGEGQGKNWWCVMFPPLCLPAVVDAESEYAVLSDGNACVVEAQDGYEIRFKIVELFEEWRQKWKEKQSKS